MMRAAMVGALLSHMLTPLFQSRCGLLVTRWSSVSKARIPVLRSAVVRSDARKQLSLLQIGGARSSEKVGKGSVFGQSRHVGYLAMGKESYQMEVPKRLLAKISKDIETQQSRKVAPNCFKMLPSADFGTCRLGNEGSGKGGGQSHSGQHSTMGHERPSLQGCSFETLSPVQRAGPVISA